MNEGQGHVPSDATSGRGPAGLVVGALLEAAYHRALALNRSGRTEEVPAVLDDFRVRTASDSPSDLHRPVAEALDAHGRAPSVGALSIDGGQPGSTEPERAR